MFNNLLKPQYQVLHLWQHYFCYSNLSRTVQLTCGLITIIIAIAVAFLDATYSNKRKQETYKKVFKKPFHLSRYGHEKLIGFACNTIMFICTLIAAIIVFNQTGENYQQITQQNISTIKKSQRKIPTIKDKQIHEQKQYAYLAKHAKFNLKKQAQANETIHQWQKNQVQIKHYHKLAIKAGHNIVKKPSHHWCSLDHFE